MSLLGKAVTANDLRETMTFNMEYLSTICTEGVINRKMFCEKSYQGIYKIV